MDPNYIEKAIVRGANPFGMYARGQKSLLKRVQEELDRCNYEDTREKIRHSMHILQEAQTSRAQQS
jgi:hypothetical protein